MLIDTENELSNIKESFALANSKDIQLIFL